MLFLQKRTWWRIGGIGVIILLCLWYGTLLLYEKHLHKRIQDISQTPIQIQISSHLSLPPSRPTFTGGYLAARFAQTHGDWDAAAQYLEQTLTIIPHPDVSLIHHVMILTIGAGQAKKAFALADKIKKQEQYFLPCFLLATQAFVQNDPQKAAQYLEIARKRGRMEKDIIFPSLKTREEAAKAALNIATTLWEKHEMQGARIFAYISQTLDPTLEPTKVLLGEIWGNNGQYTQALDAFNSIPPTSSLYVESRMAMVDILIRTDRLQKALLLLEAMPKTPDVLIQIAELHRMQDNPKSALKFYEEALKKLGTKIPPEYWYVHYMHGMALDAAGQWDEAVKALQRALFLNPNDPDLLNYLAYGWTERGINLPQAHAMLIRALEVQPEEYHIIDSFGWVLYHQGNYEKALEYLERAAQLAPYADVINDHLGDTYWRLKRYRQAHFQWRRALDNTTDGDLKKRLEHKIRAGLSTL